MFGRAEGAFVSNSETKLLREGEKLAEIGG